MKSALVSSFLLLSTSIYAQQLLIRAICYNNKNEIFRIEEKFQGGNKEEIFYLVHDNQTSFCISNREYLLGDTLIFEETHYAIKEVNPKHNMLYHHTGYSFSENKSKKTTTITFYEFNAPLGDTTISSGRIGNIHNKIAQWKKERLQKILNGQLTVSMDSLKEIQKLKVFMVQNVPLKVYEYGAEGKLIQLRLCESDQTSLTCLRYFTKNSLELSEIDTFKWNSDSTTISHKSEDVFSGNFYTTHHTINHEFLTITVNNSKPQIIRYLNPGNMFKRILFHSMIVENNYFKLQLQHFEQTSPAYVKQVGQKRIHFINKYDKTNRVIITNTLSGYKLIQQTRFVYP